MSKAKTNNNELAEPLLGDHSSKGEFKFSAEHLWYAFIQ
jgi:hypothetical protein